MSVRILQGDTLARLRSLPDVSVQCVVTSPPYYGLRSYLPANHPDKALEIGLEQSPAGYVGRLVEVFREVRRVLRDDGTCWLNIGDSYAGHNQSGFREGNEAKNGGASNKNGVGTLAGYKPKDLIGIPWRVAFALQDDGWYLRADNVWAKPNGMPESVTDRTTRSHEYVFLLTKSATYWYDHEAVRTAPKASTQTQLATPYTGQSTKNHDLSGVQNAGWDAMECEQQVAEGGNLRSVWWISPAQYSEAHFAVMPNELAEICIRAGCPVGGTVLDPFGGAGTTGLVADRLGRNAILIELSAEYADMARVRIQRDAGMFAEVA